MSYYKCNTVKKHHRAVKINEVGTAVVVSLALTVIAILAVL